MKPGISDSRQKKYVNDKNAYCVTVTLQNVRNFQYPVRIRSSRQPNLVPFYLYNRIFECPENIRNDGFPDVRWSSTT